MLPTSLCRRVPSTANTIVAPAILYQCRRHKHTPSQIRAIDFWKYPTRGGQNLSERYRRLEKSLRGKESRARTSDINEPHTQILQPSPPDAQDTVKTFRGLMIPDEPKAPEPDGESQYHVTIFFVFCDNPQYAELLECCMSGCAICVHDLYQDDLSAYRESVVSIRASLHAWKVPESEWPESIKVKIGESERKRNVSLTAFEEMERALKEKRAKETSTGQPFS
jgi:hypothetical protein